MLFLFPLGGAVLIALCCHKATTAFAEAFQPVGLLTLPTSQTMRSDLAAQTVKHAPRPVQVRGYGETPGSEVRRD